MGGSTEKPKPVALWARVLAWVIVACSCVAAAGVGIQLSTSDLTTVPWGRITPFVIAAVWVLPLFWIVALTGRPPEYWFGLETRLWKSESPRRRGGL